MCELELDKEMVFCEVENTLWPFTHHLYACTCTSLPLSLGGDNPFEVYIMEGISQQEAGEQAGTTDP